MGGTIMKTPALILAIGISTGAANIAAAQTASDLNNQVTTMNNATANQGQTNVSNKISSDFSSFLGTDSKAVVTGLRNGTPITLTSTTTTPSSVPGGVPLTTTTPVMITPPTGQMGFGNVYISLALAKQQLGALGITQPTPEQLQAALTGGNITQTTGAGLSATTTSTPLQGILTMRSQNMGWGQIAQKLGFKLGPVIAGMKSANHNLATTATPTSTTTAKTSSVTTSSGKSGSSDSGIVSASGKSQANLYHGNSNGKTSGEGIVTASGKGNGNAYGRSDIVSASGNSGASNNSGIVSARGGSGNGSMNGKGHSK
jgi:hypothetical protein